MTFKECFEMLTTLAETKRGKGAYVTLRYEMSGREKENVTSRIDAYSNATECWTAQFQSYEDVIRDFSLQLSKKKPEITP